MNRHLAALVLGGLIAGCAGPEPLILAGDAKGVDIEYGPDPAATLPVARLHCARYERVPHLLQVQSDVAYWECLRPAPLRGPEAGS